VSAARTSRRLLRFYPAAWRRRYGEELEGTIVEASEGGRVSWRTRLDVALAGSRERVRAARGGGASPADRVRGSALLVLCAWALFILGGMVVGKFSEHWQDALPPGGGSTGRVAFTVLVAAACAGSALVLAGVAAAVPSFLRSLRGDGWERARRPLIRTALVGAGLLAATAALAVWGGSLDAHQREGGEVAYAIGFVAWALLVVAAVATATAAAVTIARRIELPVRVLRALAWLGAGTAFAMALVTGATIVWWVEVGGSAPWFFSGNGAGQGGSALAPTLIAATAIMVAATLVAVRVALRGLAESPAL
jgi:hypothetical protein